MRIGAVISASVFVEGGLIAVILFSVSSSGRKKKEPNKPPRSAIERNASGPWPPSHRRRRLLSSSGFVNGETKLKWQLISTEMQSQETW